MEYFPLCRSLSSWPIIKLGGQATVNKTWGKWLTIHWPCFETKHSHFDRVFNRDAYYILCFFAFSIVINPIFLIAVLSVFNKTADKWHNLRRSGFFFGGGWWWGWLSNCDLKLYRRRSTFSNSWNLWPYFICFHTFVNVCCDMELISWN